MKYFIISQPKSGTYLLANLLVEFGIKHSYIHVGENKYEKYDPKNLDEAVRNPSKYSVKSNLENSLSLVENGSLAVSHIGHSEKKVKLLKDFKKILITRDRREIGESAERWKKDYKRGKYVKHINLKYDYESIERWKEEEDVFHLEFNDIIKINTEKLDELQMHLFPSRDDLQDSVLCARNAMSKDSITKSQFRGTEKKKVNTFDYLQIKFSKLFSKLFKK